MDMRRSGRRNSYKKSSILGINTQIWSVGHQWCMCWVLTVNNGCRLGMTTNIRWFDADTQKNVFKRLSVNQLGIDQLYINISVVIFY